jgi:hypothetical protein
LGEVLGIGSIADTRVDVGVQMLELEECDFCGWLG